MSTLRQLTVLAALTLALGGGAALRSGEADEMPRNEEIIPHYVAYEPPAGFVSNPRAPEAPEWHHPEHDHQPGVAFTFLHTANLFGEHPAKLANWPAWPTLRERIKDPRWPPVYRKIDRVLTETIIDGKAVLILDFTLHSIGAAQCWTLFWIPVAPDLFVEAQASAATPAEREQLKASLLRMRIHRYWTISGSEQVHGPTSRPID